MKTTLQRTFITASLLAWLMPKADAQWVPTPTGTPPTGITKIDSSAVSASPLSSTSVLHTNVRTISSSTTLNDYLTVAYKTTNTSLIMTPDKVDVYPGVGLFYEPDGLLLKDFPSGTVVDNLKQGATTILWQKTTAITFSSPVTASLLPGMSLAIGIFAPTADCDLIITQPGGRVVNTGRLIKASSNTVSLPILKAGQYSFHLAPVTGTTAIRASLNFNQNNISDVPPISSGQAFKFYYDHRRWSNPTSSCLHSGLCEAQTDTRGRKESGYCHDFQLEG